MAHHYHSDGGSRRPHLPRSTPRRRLANAMAPNSLQELEQPFPKSTPDHAAGLHEPLNPALRARVDAARRPSSKPVRTDAVPVNSPRGRELTFKEFVQAQMSSPEALDMVAALSADLHNAMFPNEAPVTPEHMKAVMDKLPPMTEEEMANCPFEVKRDTVETKGRGGQTLFKTPGDAQLLYKGKPCTPMYRGVWEREGFYREHDVVRFDSRYFICIKRNTGVIADPPSASVFWDELHASPSFDPAAQFGTLDAANDYIKANQGYGAGINTSLPHTYNNDGNCHNCEMVGATHAHPPGTTFTFGCPQAKALQCEQAHYAARRGPTGPSGVPCAADSSQGIQQPPPEPRSPYRCPEGPPGPKGADGTPGWSSDARLIAGMACEDKTGVCGVCGNNNFPELQIDFTLPVWFHAVNPDDNIAQATCVATRPLSMRLCHSCQRGIADWILAQTYPEVDNPTMRSYDKTLVDSIRRLHTDLHRIFEMFGVALYDNNAVMREPTVIVNELSAAWLGKLSESFAQQYAVPRKPQS